MKNFLGMRTDRIHSSTMITNSKNIGTIMHIPHLTQMVTNMSVSL